jgi:ribose transport system permease protein
MTTTTVLRTIPERQGTLAQRILRAAITPGGAVFVLVAVLLAAVIWSNPNFGDPGFLIRFVGRTAPLAIAAIGQYYVIVSGEFDLSMGAVIATQVVMAGNLIGQDEGRILPVMVLMIGVGALIGFLNGVATTLLKVPSFIVTLGMFLALGGLVKYLTGGAATGNPVDKFRQIGRGGIQDAPGFAGTSVWWTKTWAFMISSLSATIAGILLVGYAGVHPSVGQGYEFQAITAVVLGGVVLGGGRGWVLSAAAGAFALELLLALLTFQDVESTWRNTVQGFIIILAVAASARAWTLGRRPPSHLSGDPSGRRTATAVDPTASPHPRPGTDTGEH